MSILNINCISGIPGNRAMKMAMGAGILCFMLSGYGITIHIDAIRIHMVWSVVFPILIAIAYGSKYGIIAGLSGAALFPFLLWANNGYANILNFTILMMLYFFSGKLNLTNIRHNYFDVMVRILSFIVVFTIALALLYLFVFNQLLALNPPFWYQSTIIELDREILVNFLIKDLFNYLFALMTAELLLHFNNVRKFLGLSVLPGLKYNFKVFVLALSVGLFMLLVFMALDHAFLMRKVYFGNSHLLLVLSLVLWSCIIVTRILIGVMEKRVEAEQNVMEKEMMFRLVFENSIDAILWADVQSGVIIRCNQAACKLLGRSEDEIIGKPHSFLHPTKHQDYHTQLLQKISQTTISDKSEAEVISSNGDTRHVEISSTFFTVGNQAIVQEVLADVTERNLAEAALKANEAKQSAMIANIADVITIIDSKGVVRYKSPNVKKWFGWNPEDIIGENSWDNIHSDDMGRVIQFLDNILTHAGITDTIECRYKCKDGSYKWIEATATNCLNDSYIMGVLVNYKDISERRLSLALEQEVSIARKSAEFKQKFLANMSHEIRTPLTGVLGMAEILGKSKLENDQRDYLNTLMHSGENLKEIINQILDYSKIEAGQLKLNQQVFSIEDIFRDANSLFVSIYNHKDLKLEIQIATDIPEYIEGDRQRVSQIIRNLLSNAVKYTHSGKIILKASLEQAPHIKGKFPKEELVLIKIDVTDTGIGIKPEAQTRLFEPFCQAEDNITRNTEGTGLGLAICKELSAMLGGSIGLESEPGKGSTFWFTFKAKTTEKPLQSSVAIVSNENIKQLPIRILIVEDKVVNQKVISLLLKSLGHKFTICNNGLEALSVFKPGCFDLVLMDIQMPVMDGITATQKLREKYPVLPPIVGLSANAFEGDREKYIHMGLDEYLTKPINIADFQQILSKHSLKLSFQRWHPNAQDDKNKSQS